MMIAVMRLFFARLLRRPKLKQRPPAFRPRLEWLEERECPAIFNPTNGAGLVAAIAAANTNNQPDVINLQAGANYVLTAPIPNIVLDNNNTANTITLNGNGATISQTDNTDRVFNIVNGRLFMSYVTITGGNPTGFGGGIRVSDSTASTLDNLVLRNALVTNNTAAGASDGGGIFFGAGGKGTIINSTITGNRAGDNGGGLSILNTAGTVGLVNDTVTRNITLTPPGINTGSGGGINVEGGTLNISNTIVSDNHLVSLTGVENDIERSGTAVINSRNSLYLAAPTVGPGNTINGLSIANVFGQNPLLGTLRNNGGLSNTQAIVSSLSPAINTGNSSLLSPTDALYDQRGPGFNRIIGGAVDIGASEYQPSGVVIGLVSSANPALFGQPVTFTVTVVGTAANSNLPQGTVTFYVDGVARATVTLVAADASFTLSSLAVGQHAVSVLYNPLTQGDYGFAPAVSATLTQTIVPLPAPPPPPPPPPSPLSPVGRRWRR